MDWLTRIQQQAQDAADKLISSEAAEKARRLASEATKQATILAHQATIKAQVHLQLLLASTHQRA